MNRKFPYVTVGQIIDELNTELKERGAISGEMTAISRPTFYRLEKRIPNFPTGSRTSSAKPWRIFSDEEKNLIKTLIKKELFPGYYPELF